jgi:hypothetical protein
LAFRVKLRFVRSHPTKILSAKAALFVLLAFQLIVGLPLQTAQAALDIPAGATRLDMPAATRAHAVTATPSPDPATPSPTSATPSPDTATPIAFAANDDCPMHDAAHGTAPVEGSNKHAPAGNHDCCHVSACQCHCVYTPAAFDLPPLADFMSRLALPSLSSAQFVAPRIDEFLRPPIA